MLSGLAGMAAGIMAWIWPPAASLGLSAFIWTVVAGWYLVAGALELATAVRLRRMLRGEWLLGLRGALSLLLGLALLLLMWRHPLASLVGLGWMVGLASLLSGLTLLALAWRLQRLSREQPPPFSPRPSP
jgi:uncharacterized membrane protein HdeD (DUF308 family)